MSEGGARRWLGGALGGALLLLALLFALWRAQRLPEGPQPVAWDREACAECHMHVGEPRFSAQLQTSAGEVLNFDDPGCLLRYEAERRPQVHAIYFHHLQAERWLRRDQADFVPAAPTPMGYDLGAVERGRPGALSYAAAQTLVLMRSPPRGGP